MYLSGNATIKQKITFVVLGSIFWQTIILIANFRGLEKLNVVVSDCNIQYRACLKNHTYDPCTLSFNHCRENGRFIQPTEEIKLIPKKRREIKKVFTEIDQKMNVRVCNQQFFYGRKICEGLCGNALECFALCATMADEKEELSSKVCPFASLCPKGCPCPYFECTKQGKRGLQVVQDVQKYRRREMPKICIHDFSRETEKTTCLNETDLLSDSYKRYPHIIEWTDGTLSEYGFDCWYYYRRMTSVLFEGKFYLISYKGGFAEFNGVELIPRIPPPRAG